MCFRTFEFRRGYHCTNSALRYESLPVSPPGVIRSVEPLGE